VVFGAFEEVVFVVVMVVEGGIFEVVFVVDD